MPPLPPLPSPKQEKPDRPPWPRLVLRRLDQAVAAVVLVLALAGIAGHWLWQGRLAGRLIEIDRAEPIAIDFRIDINRADWPARATGNFVGTERCPALAHCA